MNPGWIIECPHCGITQRGLTGKGKRKAKQTDPLLEMQVHGYMNHIPVGSDISVAGNLTLHSAPQYDPPYEITWDRADGEPFLVIHPEAASDPAVNARIAELRGFAMLPSPEEFRESWRRAEERGEST